MGPPTGGVGSNAGSASVVQEGAGTLLLSGDDTYTGGTTIQSGTLEVAASGQVAGTIAFAGAATTLQLDVAVKGTVAEPNVLAGFAAGDTLDLRGLSFAAGATATTSGDVLRITSGPNQVTFTIDRPAGLTLSVTSDGKGGSQVSAVSGSLDPGPSAANSTLLIGHGHQTDVTALIDSLIKPGLPGDTETITAVSAAHGTATLNGGDATYRTPASGNDTLTYTATDQLGGTATGKIAVTVDSGPSVVAGTLAVHPNMPTNLSALLAALVQPGVAGDTDTITSVSAAAGSITHSGSGYSYTAPATITPADGNPLVGSDTLQFTTVDQLGDAASGSVHVAIDSTGATIDVTTIAALDAAIEDINAVTLSGTFTISVDNNIALGSTPLQAIDLAPGVSLQIEGNSNELDGGGTQRGLFVYAGAVSVHDLGLDNMLAQGGNGGNGGGGGGAGLGGGLFVGAARLGDPGSVTLSNVFFSGDKARGGNGGSGPSYPQGGGGGGFGIGGYNSTSSSPGRGGGFIGAASLGYNAGGGLSGMGFFGGGGGGSSDANFSSDGHGGNGGFGGGGGGVIFNGSSGGGGQAGFGGGNGDTGNYVRNFGNTGGSGGGGGGGLGVPAYDAATRGLLRSPHHGWIQLGSCPPPHRRPIAD